MKRTNLIILCLMASVPLLAQVDTIADNIYEKDGKLGIGTVSPDSRLEVSGMIHSTSEGYKFPDGTIQTTAAMNENIPEVLNPSRIHIGDTSLFPSTSDGPVKIVASSNYSQGVILLKNPNSSLCTGADLFNDQNLRFTIGVGGSDRPYELEKNCAFIYTSNQSSSENFMGLVIGHRYATAPIIFAQNNEEVFRIAGNGNVGIGSKTPLSKLEVSGMIHSTNEGFEFPDGTIQTTAANSSSSYWNSVSPGEINTSNKVGIDRTNFQSYFLYTKFWIHNGWLQVSDSTDHDAGIVITHLKKSGYGFARSLHQVYSGVDGDPYTEFRVRNNNDEMTDQSWAIGIDNSDGNKLKITSRTDNPTGASPSFGDNKMTITADGNIGIGTDSPLSKLEVNGLIQSTNEGFKFPDGTIQTTAATNENIPGMLTPSRIYIGDTSLFPPTSDGPVKIVASSNYSQGVILLKNPNSSLCTGADLFNDQNLRFTIGIGGSDRPFELEKNCAFIYTSNQSSSDNIMGLVIGHRYATAPIIFAQKNEEVFRIAGNGNVGIGTSNPNTKLEIADGDIYINDTSHGIIMKSPDGNCWRGKLDNSGNLVFTLIDCPSDNPFTSNIESTRPENNISIFPNPVENTVTISILKRDFKNAKVVIYTIDGKIVRKNELDNDYTILNLNNIPSGSYIIKVIDKRGNALGSETIVKE